MGKRSKSFYTKTRQNVRFVLCTILLTSTKHDAAISRFVLNALCKSNGLIRTLRSMSITIPRTLHLHHPQIMLSQNPWSPKPQPAPIVSKRSSELHMSLPHSDEGSRTQILMELVPSLLRCRLLPPSTQQAVRHLQPMHIGDEPHQYLPMRPQLLQPIGFDPTGQRSWRMLEIIWPEDRLLPQPCILLRI